MNRYRTAALDASAPAQTPMRLTRTLLVSTLFISLVLGLLALSAPPLRAQDNATSSDTTNSDTGASDTDTRPHLVILTFEGPVTPILETYLSKGIQQATATQAAAVVLRLDTPGGSVEVTKSIVQHMLASPVPIVVYVAPAGARAGSAGTFITLAGHVAAMAPGTSIGAASPVDMSGGDIDETLAAKITNMLSADIENLADRRGQEATEWAIAAVQDAAAATAQQALDLGVVDLIASDLDDLARQLDERRVTIGQNEITLHTRQATFDFLEMTPIQRGLNLLVDPNVAAILLSLGILGLIIEIRTPGFGFPGILGALCLLLAFYGVGQLDANLTGLALMAVALALFVAEAFTPSFGVLAVGGVIAFILGGALLFDAPGVTVPWTTLILVGVGLGGLAIFGGVKALQAQRNPVVTGGEALIGQIGRVQAPFDHSTPGAVMVAGEWWNARLTEGEVAPPTRVRVVGRDGFTLIVEPLTDWPITPDEADQPPAHTTQQQDTQEHDPSEAR